MTPSTKKPKPIKKPVEREPDEQCADVKLIDEAFRLNPDNRQQKGY